MRVAAAAIRRTQLKPSRILLTLVSMKLLAADELCLTYPDYLEYEYSAICQAVLIRLFERFRTPITQGLWKRESN